MAAELLISPNITEINSSPLPAPVYEDRRFVCLTLEESHRESMFNGEVEVPINALGHPMSPVEASTGVTLPIIARQEGHPSKHHAHFYGTTYKAGGPGARALRFSRLQKIPKTKHTDFHRVIDGTALPADDHEAYTVTILNSAGYIPKYGLEITIGDMAITEITPEDKKLLRKPKAFLLERSLKAQAEIGKFLMDYALEQDFDYSEQSRVEEFLAITPEKIKWNDKLRERKLRLGMRLANKALSAAIEPISAEYRRARDEEYLRKNTPSSAWEFVKGLIGGREVDYIPTLEARLKQEYGLQAA